MQSYPESVEVAYEAASNWRFSKGTPSVAPTPVPVSKSEESKPEPASLFTAIVRKNKPTDEDLFLFDNEPVVSKTTGKPIVCRACGENHYDSNCPSVN